MFFFFAEEEIKATDVRYCRRLKAILDASPMH